MTDIPGGSGHRIRDAVLFFVTACLTAALVFVFETRSLAGSLFVGTGAGLGAVLSVRWADRHRSRTDATDRPS